MERVSELMTVRWKEGGLEIVWGRKWVPEKVKEMGRK